MKNLGILLSGSAIAQVLNVLGLPLLSRFYSPESIGALAVFSALLGITAIVATFRFDLALIQASGDEADVLSWLVLISALPIVLFLSVGLLCWGSIIPEWLNTPSLDQVIYWLPVLLCLQVIWLLWVARLNHQGLFKKIASSRVIQVFFILVVSLLYGVFSGEVTGLILGLFAGMSVSLYFLLRGAPLSCCPSIPELKSVIKKYINFPTIVLLAALLDALAVLLTPLWIGIRYGEEAAGYFSLTWKVFSFPMVMVGLAVSQVFYREVSIRLRSDKRAALNLLLKSWAWMFLVGVVPFYVVFVYSGSLFPLVFGPEWNLPGELAQVLLPLAFIMFINSPTSSIFLLDNGRYLLILFSLSELFVRLLSIFILGDSLQASLEYMTMLEVLVVIFFNVLAIKRVF